MRLARRWLARNAPRSVWRTKQPVRRLPLPVKTVHVWRLDDALIDVVCNALNDTLSPEEQQRAASLKRDKHRRRFVARRGALRWLIGAYLSRQPEAVRFYMSRHGKPMLRGAVAGRLAFNVSHTDGMALLAFAWNCLVGVDVERKVDNVDVADIGHGLFSPIEQNWLDAAWPAPMDRFLSIWTRKEALLKALGTGLAGEPDRYTTEDDPQRGEGHWRASHDGVPLCGWTFVDLPLGPRFRGALAVSLAEVGVSLRPVAAESFDGNAPL